MAYNIEGAARIAMMRVAREAGREAGRKFATRPCTGGPDFFHTESDVQDAGIEACMEFGLSLSDDTDDLCEAFTSAFFDTAAYVLAREGRLETDAAPTVAR